MPIFAEATSSSAAASAALLTGWAILAGLLALALRQLGVPVVPYHARRPVPWRGSDVGLILSVYLGGHLVVAILAGAIFGRSGPGPGAAVHAKQINEHPIATLIEQGNVWALLVGVLAAAVVAPIAEELFFRVILQGWLEVVEGRWRRRLRCLRQISRGAIAVVLAALPFALLHFRLERDEDALSLSLLFFVVAAQGAVTVLTMGFAIVWLRVHRDAASADLGWAPQRFLADLGLGLLAAVAVCPLVYLVLVLSSLLVPKSLAADPIPLFFFAVALGTLYYRTHRIMPPVVLHMALNVASLAMALVAPGR